MQALCECDCEVFARSNEFHLASLNRFLQLFTISYSLLASVAQYRTAPRLHLHCTLCLARLCQRYSWEEYYVAEGTDPCFASWLCSIAHAQLKFSPCHDNHRVRAWGSPCSIGLSVDLRFTGAGKSVEL